MLLEAVGEEPKKYVTVVTLLAQGGEVPFALGVHPDSTNAGLVLAGQM